jgi:hypothetical protein
MIYVSQKVEGFNATRLLDGSSGIAETTVSADIIIHADGSSGLSFPVKVAFSIHTWDGTGRQCVGDVSIAANDTWERVSVTFPSDSTATFDSNNAAAGHLTVSICGGSGRQATNLTWANDANDYITSATDNIADQANNYLGITNVQWEVGAVPTSYAYEDIGTTVAKCQRYLIRWVATEGISFIGSAYSTTAMQGVIFFPEMRRAAATFSISAGSDFKAYTATLSAGNNFSTLTDPGSDGYKTQRLQGTGTSGIVAGYAINCVSSNTNAWMQISREL